MGNQERGKRLVAVSQKEMNELVYQFLLAEGYTEVRRKYNQSFLLFPANNFIFITLKVNQDECVQSAFGFM